MELRDLYDKNKEKTNETIYSTDEIPKNRYILVELALIQNSKGEILIQKRSVQKGGEYALISGHAKTGETPLQGIISEIREEIGINVIAEELTLIYSERDDNKRNFYDLFYLKKDYDISKMILQEEEVSEVIWLKENDVRTLCSNNNFKKSHIEAFEIIMKKLKEREWLLCRQQHNGM